jgi:hypothetical protein
MKCALIANGFQAGHFTNIRRRKKLSTGWQRVLTLSDFQILPVLMQELR